MPGQQPANRSQEKEFVQAYEDVLERYKGAAGGAAGAGRPGGVASTPASRLASDLLFLGPAYLRS